MKQPQALHVATGSSRTSLRRSSMFLSLFHLTLTSLSIRLSSMYLHFSLLLSTPIPLPSSLLLCHSLTPPPPPLSPPSSLPTITIFPHFTTLPSLYLEHIVSVDIAKVAADLCSHVPATERSSRVFHSTHVQHDVGDSGKSVPLQT